MAETYLQSRYSFDKGRQKVWKAICEYLSKYIPCDSVVLELGSGYCDFINNIKASKKIAVDINSDLKKYCNPDIEFINSNVVDINFQPDSVGIVFASNLFEHLNDKELDIIIEKILNCLNSNGRLILMQPNYKYSFRDYWDDYTHIKVFSHISLSDFLKSKGFKLLKVEKRFLPFSFKSFLPKSYFLTRLYLRTKIRPFAKQMLIIAEK